MADLEDFESYLDPDFNASKFSNDLICATNEADTDELDIGTSMKKLKFDIQECDKRMTSIASSNHEPLVAICSQVGPTKDYANETLKPLVDRLVSAFDKIKSGILVPYEEALESNQALKRLHSTLDLLRRTSYFLFLIQQFDELNQDGDRDDVRLAKLSLQLGQRYETEKEYGGNSEMPSVLSVKLVRDYQSTFLTSRLNFISKCQLKISEDFNHQSTFTYTNKGLTSRIAALYILDSKKAFSSVESGAFSRQVLISLGLLTRSLQSPRNFTTIANEVFDTSKTFLEKLIKVVAAVRVEPEFLGSFLTSVNQKSLADLYWDQLALGFKRSVASTMARGGPIAKNLRLYHEGIKKAIVTTFEDESVAERLNEGVDLIVSRQQ